MRREWLEEYLCPICSKPWAYWPGKACAECIKKEREREPDWIEKVVGKKSDKGNTLFGYPVIEINN